MEVEKLLLKIHAGKRPTESELEEVVQLLTRVSAAELVGSGVVDDVYSAILVIGRGKILEQGHLVAKFLDSKDALTVSLILETFCLEWGIFDEYFERIVDFALGVSWDSDFDVRQMAIKVLGEYLESRLRPFRSNSGQADIKPTARVQKVLELLFGIVDDQEANEEVRTAAYRACRRGSGVDPESLPDEGEIVSFTTERFQELEPLRALAVADGNISSASSPVLSGVSSGRTSPGMR